MSSTATPSSEPPVDPKVDQAEVRLQAEVRHTMVLAVGMLAAAAIGFFALGNGFLGEDASMAYPVMLVGGGAAAVNNVRRFHGVHGGGDRRSNSGSAGSLDGDDGSDKTAAEAPMALEASVVHEVDRRVLIGQIYLSPVIGGTFALLVYVMCMSGVVQGDFFPAFACADESYSGFRGLSNCSPTTNGDAAKSLIWAFAAGFSERFVPNVLDNFTRNRVI